MIGVLEKCVSVDAIIDIQDRNGGCMTDDLCIMLVDDEEMVCDITASMIAELGHTAIAITDSEEALHRFKDENVDLVIVDLSMPKISGSELIVAMRQHSPEIPILLSSGYNKDKASQDLPVSDNIVYLRKPYVLDGLETAINQLLKRSA